MVGRSFSAGERAARAASPRSFRRGMRQAGIDDLETVLSYDDVGGVNCRSAGMDAPGVGRSPRRPNQPSAEPGVAGLSG